MRILLTGGTGWIGRGVASKLRADGHEVAVLTRSIRRALDTVKSQVRFIEWDPRGSTVPDLTGFDPEAVIHLAGESIARRWTKGRKREIRDSRVNSTSLLMKALRPVVEKHPVRVICASAIGYYGPRGDEELDETSPGGKGFLADLCRKWESAALDAGLPQSRRTCVRIGVVLGRGGGALKKLLPAFRVGLGGPSGSGRQWMSWIHYDDLISLIAFLLSSPDAPPVVNATAPHPVTNRDFADALGRALGVPAVLPAPAFLLKLALGEMADVVLEGQRVLPHAAEKIGFHFTHPQLDEALASIRGRRL
jgi:uncharacterized protein (TIGR01777 family)